MLFDLRRNICSVNIENGAKIYSRKNICRSLKKRSHQRKFIQKIPFNVTTRLCTQWNHRMKTMEIAKGSLQKYASASKTACWGSKCVNVRHLSFYCMAVEKGKKLNNISNLVASQGILLSFILTLLAARFFITSKGRRGFCTIYIFLSFFSANHHKMKPNGTFPCQCCQFWKKMKFHGFSKFCIPGHNFNMIQCV